MTSEDTRASDLERLARLRPMDDDFMRVLFRDDLPLTQQVLRTLTGIRDLTLVKQDAQHELSLPAGPRSVVLDVWGQDSLGTWYDLEIQRGSRPNPRRARYHGAAMDVAALRRADGFDALPERYIVFVMEGDPFGLGEGLYPVETVNLKTGAPFGDGAHVLYANGGYRGDDELGRLMHDLSQSDPGRMHEGPLRERASWLKSNPKGVADMCEIFDEVRREGLAQGLEQGREQERLAGVRSLMARLQMSARDAMDALGVPEADRARIAAML